MAAPVEVVSFLRAHGSGATPWQVKVYALDGAGDGFGGYRVVSAKTAEPVLADELIARLANDGSYASYRCEAPPFGVRIERDGAALSFVADCRVRIDGTRDVAGFSPEMLVFMMKLEATTVPCKWVRLDYFDLEVCVDKTMHYAGGAEMTLLSGITCPQVVISGLHLPGDNTRRIGSVDVSCSHRDSSACAAICDSLRPTPNSTATATFPEGPPEIRSTTGGGFSGDTHTTTIWHDGTVVFSGTRCRKLRAARTRLDPQQVTELLARLASERSAEDTRAPCADCVSTRVLMLVGDELVELYGQAATIISAAVGRNPC